MSILPDPQRVYAEALDDKFSELMEQRYGTEFNEDADEMYREWFEIDNDALTFDSSHYDGYDDPQEAYEIMDLAMGKNMAERIHAKERLLTIYFEDCPHCIDGTCTSLEDGELE